MTAALPAGLRGPVGDIHTLRRGIRRRPGARIGDDGTNVRLLLESGEELTVPLTELPPVSPSPVPWDSVVRSAPGRLLELAAAIVSGRAKQRWDPEALRTAALATAQDQVTMRLLALDALALDMEDLLPRLGLSPSERTWLVAVRCAQRGDAARVVREVGGLPPDGYRPKIFLLLGVAAAIHELGLDVSMLDPQLRPFLAHEPAAALLHRAFGLSPSDTTTAAADALWLAATLHPDDPMRGAVEWGVARVLDEEPAAGAGAVALAGLGPHVRGLAGLRVPGSAYLDAGDVGALADAVVDDLVDQRSLDAATALAAPRDAAAGLYLRGRLAPATLEDDGVVALGHDDERARRTFPFPDPAELEALADSPRMRHFRALALVRLKRGAEVVLDDVDLADRPKVTGLQAALDAATAGRPVIDQLTNALLLDPTVWPVLVGMVGPAALEPSADLSEQFPAFCEWLALHHAREHLYRGDWAAAVAAADRCLGLAKDERVRDEALNLKACGLHYGQDSKGAIAALEEAIDGAYSDALLANIGVVAANLAPEVAARYLGKLMLEAPTTAMRAAAGRRVVHLWAANDTGSWHTSGDSSLPDVVRDPFRQIVAADIELDDFRSFAALLARHDDDWFADASHLAGSPHRDTLDARFYLAHARGLGDMVDVMAAALKAGDAPDWLRQEQRSLREQTVEYLLGNIDDPTVMIGPLAIAMFEKGVVESAYDKVLVPALGLASLALHFNESSTETADRLVPLTHDMRRRWKALDTDDHERVEPVVEVATRRMAINRCIGREGALNDAIDLFNATLRLGEATGNFPLVRMRMGQVRSVAIDVAEELQVWMGAVDPPDLRQSLRETIATAHELDARCTRFV